MQFDESYLRKIVQFFNDSENASLQEEINALRAISPSHESFYQEILLIWAMSPSLKNFDSINVNQATERLSLKLSERRPSIKTEDSIFQRSWFLRVAAVLLSGVLAYLVYSYSNKVNYIVKTTPKMLRDSVLLSDGTKIYLDENTTLKYPEKFNGDLRKIYLESGNAFFSVAHDKKHPFIVQSRQLQITVLGTSFNVVTDDTELAVSVKTGSVRFQSSLDESIVIPSGQGILYDINTGVTTHVDVTNTNTDAWLTHKLTFSDASLKEVLSSLESYYNVTIKLEDSVAKFKKFNATFSNNKLHEVLEVLQATYPIHITREDTLIVIKSNHLN